MAKFSSPDLNVYVDNAGGSLVDLSSYIKTIGGFAPSVAVADTTTFGAAWDTFQAHLKSGGEFSLEGDYDTTATTGPNAILNSIGSTRSVRIRWAGTGSGLPQSLFEAIILKYERGAQVGNLQSFTATLRVTGAVDETDQ
jgi:hypothetical protein